MGFNFPNSPALNDTYAPVGGPVFTWDGTAWKGTSQGAPVTVYVSDTAPLSPAIGQLWWNSATGTMAIWYADADSAQWVQVSGQVLPTAPSDNGEYVMVNGVWRLVRQSFNLAGLTQQDITVPAWGPTQAQMAIYYFATAGFVQMRVSLDGTTFIAGATDYGVGGFLHQSGSGGYQNQPSTNSSQWLLTAVQDNANIPTAVDVVVALTRTAAGFTGMRSIGTSYLSAANAIWQHYHVMGSFYGGATSTSLKAIRLIFNSTAVSGKISVDWLA